MGLLWRTLGSTVYRLGLVGPLMPHSHPESTLNPSILPRSTNLHAANLITLDRSLSSADAAYMRTVAARDQP